MLLAWGVSVGRLKDEHLDLFGLLRVSLGCSLSLWFIKLARNAFVCFKQGYYSMSSRGK